MHVWVGICCLLGLCITCLHELVTGHEQGCVLSPGQAPRSLTYNKTLPSSVAVN